MAEVFQLRSAGDQGPRHFVRVTCADHRGFVEFQFSIDDPALYLEMTLPPAAFAEFCSHHGALHLSTDQADAVDIAARRWQLGRDFEDDACVD